MPEAPTAIMPTYGRLPVTFTHGEGAVLYDTDGRPYLDGVSGIAVTNLGHQHPRVTEAITEQAKRLVHTSNLFHIGLQEAVADQLRSLTGMEKTFFCNSGAEANEAAIKLARRFGHSRGVASPQMIVLRCLHGRTLGALSATGTQKIRRLGHARGLPPRSAERPVCRRSAGSRAERYRLDHGRAHHGRRRHWLDIDYLAGLRERCTQNGWLPFSMRCKPAMGAAARPMFEQLGVTPDVLLTAKGLGNGLPIGVVWQEVRRHSNWVRVITAPLMAGIHCAVPPRKPF